MSSSDMLKCDEQSGYCTLQQDPYGTLWKLMNMFKISNKTFIVSFHRIELQQG